MQKLKIVQWKQIYLKINLSHFTFVVSVNKFYQIAHYINPLLKDDKVYDTIEWTVSANYNVKS